MCGHAPGTVRLKRVKVTLRNLLASPCHHHNSGEAPHHLHLPLHLQAAACSIRSIRALRWRSTEGRKTQLLRTMRQHKDALETTLEDIWVPHEIMSPSLKPRRDPLLGHAFPEDRGLLLRGPHEDDLRYFRISRRGAQGSGLRVPYTLHPEP